MGARDKDEAVSGGYLTTAPKVERRLDEDVPMTDAGEGDAGPPPMLTLERLNAFLSEIFPPSVASSLGRVERQTAQSLLMVRPFTEDMLRPGRVVSGPTLMALADVAAFALILGRVGEQPMTVTTALNIHFLRPARPGPVSAEATLLRLGRRLAVVSVRLWTNDDDDAAMATVTYALPPAERRSEP